jgi:spore germination protein YaaH
VYSSFGDEKNRRFYTEPDAQTRWIEELVDLAVEIGVDGINVDVELLPAEHVLDYGVFVGRLRAALRERVPDAQVSVATQANERGAAMAVAAAAAGADRIFLMGYDYHWAGSDPGASAPIERLDGEVKDLVWSLDLYGALGVPVDRTILGLPLYGMTWPTIGPGVGSPATGRGDTWVPRLNLRVFEDPDFEPTYEPIQSVEFYSVPADGAGEGSGGEASGEATGSGSESAEPGWNAVYYDSPRSLAPKLALADERGLAGAGFWAIGYERGLPGYTDLIKTFRAGELTVP